MHDAANSPRSFNSNAETFRFLGSSHDDRGHETYRIGRRIHIDGDRTFSDLASQRAASVAAGTIPVNNDHNALHVYGSSRNAANTAFDFRMVIENRDGGHVYAELYLLDGDEVAHTIEGFVSPVENAHGGDGRLESLSSDVDNIVIVHTREGDQMVNLGKVELVVVDCGTIQKSSATHRSERKPDSLSLYLDGALATGEYGNLPISTLHRSALAARFLTQPAARLNANVAHGHISALPNSDFGLAQ